MLRSRYCPHCQKEVPITGGITVFEGVMALMLFCAGLVPGLLFLMLVRKPFHCAICGAELK